LEKLLKQPCIKWAIRAGKKHILDWVRIYFLPKWFNFLGSLKNRKQIISRK
jgi:hypothetical protein